MKIIDLCSGMGGASEAFIQAGDDVVRIDNNVLLSEVPHTIMMTIQEFRDWLIQLRSRGHVFPKVDLIWASPPCLAFSNAYGAPRSKAGRAGAEYSPDLSILKCCVEIIEILKPRYYVIENVAGAIKFFKPNLGAFNQKIGPFFLWGKFPHIIIPGDFKHSKVDGDVWSDNPLRANIRGKIPFQMSASLRKAMISQKTIMDY